MSWQVTNTSQHSLVGFGNSAITYTDEIIDIFRSTSILIAVSLLLAGFNQHLYNLLSRPREFISNRSW